MVTCEKWMKRGYAKKKLNDVHLEEGKEEEDNYKVMEWFKKEELKKRKL